MKLLSICLGVIMALSGVEYKCIQDAIMNADSITVNISQNEYVVDKGSAQYDGLMDFVQRILDGSHQVPALGVAIHSEVIEEKKNKNWIEFKFGESSECGEMPFDSLLIFLEKDMGGINVLRSYKGKYEGRCFYINLNSNLSDFFNILN